MSGPLQPSEEVRVMVWDIIHSPRVGTGDAGKMIEEYASRKAAQAVAAERERIVGELEAKDKSNDALMTSSKTAFDIKMGFGSGIRCSIVIAKGEQP